MLDDPDNSTVEAISVGNDAEAANACLSSFLKNK
jgi:hypothetical protein